MGFGSATFGIIIDKHMKNVDKILKLIAKEYTVENNTDKFKSVYHITLHDDIYFDSEERQLTLTYDSLFYCTTFYYNDIVISNVGCHYMIHFGFVDYFNISNIEIDWESLDDLKKWKDLLIKDGRLDEDAELALVTNCCS